MRIKKIMSIDNLKYIPFSDKRIGYIGWLGHGNLGDEAMYTATQLAFDHKPLLPYKYHEAVNSLEKLFKKRVYKSVILGGGTLINCQDYWAQLNQAQKNKYPTSIFGAGVRNPDYWSTIGEPNMLNQWIPLLERCSFVGLRGPISKSLLEQHGFYKSEVIGDPALFLARPEIKEKVMNKRIGLNIGISQGRIWGKESEVLDFIIDFARTIIDKGWEITFVPVWGEDLPYIKEAVRRIGKNIRIFNKYNSIEETLRFIESCDIFVGEKLHSVILACCTYTPSIMLEYRPKCIDFMASLDLKKYNMRTDSLDKERLISLCNELYENIDSFQTKIFKNVNAYKEKLKKYALLLGKDIEYENKPY
jgi:polysaccharide pyruvyl transferase WcaK-like protein